MTIFTHPDEPGRNVSVRDDQSTTDMQSSTTIYNNKQQRSGPVRAAHIRIPEEQKYLKKSIPNQQLQPTR
jgi:hypothetical protein